MENSKKWLSLRLFVAMANERKWDPRCVANIHFECQEHKPKVETNTGSSFLVLHPSSDVDTINTVGSHLKKKVFNSPFRKRDFGMWPMKNGVKMRKRLGR